MIEATPRAGPAGLPDAVHRQWLFRIAPPAALPFLQLARLDRPIGYWLLVLPCWWSSALASLATYRRPDLWQLALFLIGATVMRGAGSTYNDIVDRHLDAQVERTRHRPVASGRVGVAAARAFMVAQALVGFLVVLRLNWFTIALCLGSLAIVAAYPFAKRVTSWPQLILGLAFAWGGLVGWAGLTGSLAAPAFAIYGAAIAWTIGYDTIYAIQDMRDDEAAGIRSTARLFGPRLRLAVGLFYAAAVLLAEIGIAAAGGAGSLWAQAGVAGFALHLCWQVAGIDLADPAGALRLFRSNRDAGLILFVGLALAATFNAV